MLAFLSNIKLTLLQWLYVAGAAIVGGLVVALKVQGSELHAAKVQLLEANLKATLQKPQADVLSAQRAFNDALLEYTNAGGEL
jgi:hypothetical protein